ncbi:MAG: agmatinase [Pseudomonadota bacterium]
MTTVGDGAFRRESLYGRSNDMGYSGALSFLRRKYTRDLTGVDVAVTGIPFDSATSNRPGARFGPRGIREMSTEVASLDGFPFNFNPFDYLAVVDYGDVWLDYGFPESVVEKVERHADKILNAGASMLSFGGDHFVTYPLLRAHTKKHGSISLVHFDAHSDTWEDDGERIDHGSMFLRAARDGIVNPETSVQIGIRTQNDCTHGFNIYHAPWVHRHGVDAMVEKIYQHAGTQNPVYITFDIDCLDPAFAPGTGTPVPGGLSSAQALEILRALGDLNLIGMDVVEVAPAYDSAGISALAAATLAHDYLCLMAMKKGATAREIGTSLDAKVSETASNQTRADGDPQEL